MLGSAKKPVPTSAELKAAYFEWKKKEKRFNVVAKRRKSESSIELAARSAEDAFEVVCALLRNGTGARPNEACAVVLADGCHLVAFRLDGERSGNDSLQVQLVSSKRVFHAS